jgi:hypothetical protein
VYSCLLNLSFCFPLSYLDLQTPILKLCKVFQSEYNSQSSRERVCKTYLYAVTPSFGQQTADLITFTFLFCFVTLPFLLAWRLINCDIRTSYTLEATVVINPLPSLTTGYQPVVNLQLLVHRHTSTPTTLQVLLPVLLNFRLMLLVPSYTSEDPQYLVLQPHTLLLPPIVTLMPAPSMPATFSIATTLHICYLCEVTSGNWDTPCTLAEPSLHSSAGHTPAIMYVDQTPALTNSTTLVGTLESAATSTIWTLDTQQQVA